MCRIYALDSFPSMRPRIYLPRRFSVTARRRKSSSDPLVHLAGTCRTHGRGSRRCRYNTVPDDAPATCGRDRVNVPSVAADRRVSAVARVGGSIAALETGPAAAWSGTAMSGCCDNDLERTSFHKATVLAVVESTDHNTSTGIAVTNILLTLLWRVVSSVRSTTDGLSSTLTRIVDRPVTIDRWIFDILYSRKFFIMWFEF